MWKSTQLSTESLRSTDSMKIYYKKYLCPTDVLQWTSQICEVLNNPLFLVEVQQNHVEWQKNMAGGSLIWLRRKELALDSCNCVSSALVPSDPALDFSPNLTVSSHRAPSLGFCSHSNTLSSLTRQAYPVTDAKKKIALVMARWRARATHRTQLLLPVC